MDISEAIIEASEKIGMDRETALDLYKTLCKENTLASRYAANSLIKAIALYGEADDIMKQLAALADRSGNLDL